MVFKRENYPFPRIQKGSNIFQGGPTFSRGAKMLLSIETLITCAFPGEGCGLPPPSGSAHENIRWNIGITHVFSCINICRVPEKLFEYEAARPSVKTSSEGPGKC